jgi:hypothetical protein
MFIRRRCSGSRTPAAMDRVGGRMMHRVSIRSERRPLRPSCALGLQSMAAHRLALLGSPPPAWRREWIGPAA